MNQTWTAINPARNTFDWSELDAMLQFADDQNQMFTVKVAPIDGSSPGATMPTWMFSQGVPQVTGDIYTYGYYLDPDYKIYFEEMVRAFAKHVREDVPPNLQNRIAFVRVDTGATGDEEPYENAGSITDPQYDISPAEWLAFREWAFELYRQAFQEGPGPVIPLLFVHVEPGQYDDEWAWINNNVTGGLGVKYDGSTRGHHLSFSGDTPDAYKALAEDSAVKIFSRSEMDQTFGKPFFQKNVHLGMYWCAVEQLNAGMSIWDVTQNCLEDAAVNDYNWVFRFFNEWAAELEPPNARGGFCIFHEGLDSADASKFPTSSYGGGSLNKGNTNRYEAICADYASQGAEMSHLLAATWGQVAQRRDQNDYNDAGWEIWAHNYDRYITQLDPESTSLGLWRVRGNLNASSHPFDRFARRFDSATGRNTMYFDVHDNLTPN
ncbi:MAG: hypothetical protein KJN98_06965, partial [Pontiella sp.]|nr:hypothetical protein [Pontiella sp.]